jgi:hypothetical protein
MSKRNDRHVNRGPTTTSADTNALVRIVHTVSGPWRLKKPLPDNPAVLQRLCDEVELFIQYCEAFIADYWLLECERRRGGRADLSEVVARIVQTLPPPMILAMDYFPATTEEGLLRLVHILMTKYDSDYPGVEEILADKGLLAAIEWLARHARNLRYEVVKKLARAAPACSEEEGWLVGTRSELNRAMGMSGHYTRFLEKQSEGGVIDFKRVGRKFGIRLKDPDRYREVEAKLKKLRGV